jgi:hypothetical protein
MWNENFKDVLLFFSILKDNSTSGSGYGFTSSSLAAALILP